ncbi:hypothetical protein BDZ89DRAFT_1075270 [Hymenopellis radicata]|nr:hypothetical protein BDZ89DRAFT_1075270 [Hymenopellis radicata]
MEIACFHGFNLYSQIYLWHVDEAYSNFGQASSVPDVLYSSAGCSDAFLTNTYGRASATMHRPK